MFIKKIYSLLIGLLFINAAFAKAKKIENPELKSKMSNYMAVQLKSVAFLENKGQMVDIDGKPAPYVFFMAQAPNLNIWVTNKGLTYQFYKVNRKCIDKKDEIGADSNSVEWKRIDMTLKNASIRKENIEVSGDVTQGEVNYYLGHCPEGIFNVKSYTKIIIKEIYKGIDWWLYTSKDGGIKHDFIVHPNADPNLIKLIYEGSGKFELNKNKIYFENQIGKLTEGDLVCYQGSESNPVSSQYTLTNNSTPLYLGAGHTSQNTALIRTNNTNKNKTIFSYEVSITVSKYNKNTALIIDPQLYWATFSGGNYNSVTYSIDCDNSGNVYGTGWIYGTPYPLQAWGGAYMHPPQILNNSYATIFKFSGTGALIWSTIYGGSTFGCQGRSINIDVSGNILVCGTTTTNTFPLQNWAGAYNQAYAGVVNGTSNAFILRFTNTGVRTWATCYGGTGGNAVSCITTDLFGNIYVVGKARNPMPVQNWGGAYNQAVAAGGNDGFIMRFSNLGACTWATFYGGSTEDGINSVVCDATSGSVYVCGETRGGTFPTLALGGAYNQNVFGGPTTGGAFFQSDGFILNFSATGSLNWATYFGGNSTEYAREINVDSNGNVYVLGETSGGTIPMQNWGSAYYQPVNGGGGDMFIARFSTSGALTWSTFYGGSLNENAGGYALSSIEIDACNNVYVTFTTYSDDIYTKQSDLCSTTFNDLTLSPGLLYKNDVFIVKFSSTGVVLWATYFGGSSLDYSGDLALDNKGDLFVTGGFNAYDNAGSVGTLPLKDPGGGAYFDTQYQVGGSGSPQPFMAKFIQLPPVYQQTQTNPGLCACNGVAEVSVSCSEANFSYQWSNGVIQSNVTSSVSSISGLCAGTYWVEITSGCSVRDTLFFNLQDNGSTLSANFTQTNASCISPTGTITLTSVTNGTSGYTITEGATTIVANINTPYTINGITVGTHTYLITDASGCSVTKTISIVAPPPLLGQISKGTAPCSNCGCKEWVMINAINGTPPYIYLWPDGSDNRFKNKLCTGNYTVKVTDKNGCSVDVNLTTP